MPTIRVPAAVPLGSLDTAGGGQLANDLTTMWLILTGLVVFFMQCGFALLEAGGIRAKNTANIMLKNVINTCLAALVWFAVGEAFAHGDCGKGSNPFIGLRNFFFSTPRLRDDSLAYVAWFFSWVFAAVSVTIPSGALAERCQLRAYVVYTIIQTGWTYPIVVHWVWSSEGWLSPFRADCSTGVANLYFPKSVGLIDFAGSGNVHMTGGGAALVGAWLLGPRIGRFRADGLVGHMPGCNFSNRVMGTLILWFGWYGFNAGSTGCAYNCMFTAARIAMNTTLAASAGGLSALFFETMRGAPGDVGPTLNGILAGLVGITSACGVVKPYAALVIGIISGAVLCLSSMLMVRLRIDDPLDSTAVHFFCGIWGLLAPGFFATASGTNAAYGTSREGDSFAGVFYGGNGYQLGIQILGTVVIAAWTLSINFAVFKTLQLLGWLRVEEAAEEKGLDYSQSIGTGSWHLPWLHG